MPSTTFWIFILVGAYLLIGEALFRVRRNTRKGKRAEEIMGVKGFRIMYLVLGVVVIGAAFIWFF